MNDNASKAIAERLPGYDRKTRGWEWAAFVSLGLVALATIGFAVSGAVKFAAGHEGVVAALPAQIASHAEMLAKRKDVSAARTPFKALSGYLIQYAKTSNAVGTYHEVHCPKANVNWLQNDKTVRNPHLGKSTPQCGTFKS